MYKGRRVRLFGYVSQWVALTCCAALGIALFTLVDLKPKVQADFFFSTDDPQLQNSLRIERIFGYAPQVFVVAKSPRIASRDYLLGLHRLTEDLRKVDGIVDVRSLTHGPKEPGEVLNDDLEDVFEDLDESPFWKALLLAPDRSATFIAVRLREENHESTIRALDEALDRHSRTDFELGATGVPYVAEHIRLRLVSDLKRFSIAAFVTFSLLVALLFRSAAVLVGTMVAAAAASCAMFLARAMLGMETDILSPNLWTIAFVLTLSHVVYLTAEWRRTAQESGAEQALRDAIRMVGPASAWSLAANLLGFASLIFVSAKPLRQFGVSGAIAAALAMVCAFTIFPPFLRAARVPTGRRGRIAGTLDRFFTRRHMVVSVATIAVATVLAPIAWRVNTDPTLPSYFSDDDKVRTGLEAIDRAGGSALLDLVVADSGNRPLDDDDAFERLQALQRDLEEHPDAGSVLSIALLMAEAERPWYSFLFSWETRLERLESPEHGRVGRTFISQDRKKGRYILRMREETRSRPRDVVVREIEQIVERHGFEPVLVGGLYPLQGELSRLVDGSVVRGLGGLLACFFIIVLIVTRSLRVSLAMGLSLAITPFALFGLVGLLRMPLDIISAPAANVALPLGIDEMIHLGYSVRRHRNGAGRTWAAWRGALGQLWMPILVSMTVVASGFALFLLSSFPPTRRLGILVCIGAALTDLVVLVVLPAIATIRSRNSVKQV